MRELSTTYSAIRARAHREKDRAAYNERARLWRIGHVEQTRKSSRDWQRKDRLANPLKYIDRDRKWRIAHPSVYIGTEASKKYYPAIYARQTSRQILLQRLKEKPCMDCQGWFPTCAMQFDHRDPKLKLHNLSRLRSSSLKKIMEEIAKCDVVCANCHFIRTNSRKAERYGWMMEGHR